MSAVEALQTTLAAEHAAVWVFGTLGGRAAALRAPTLRTGLATAYDVHVARRDQLRTRIVNLGAVPVAAEPAYVVPGPLTTADELSARALSVESACLTTYAALVAATAGHDRAWAIDALTAGATAELGFGGAPQPLPGLHPRHRG
jgi:hypothetical protein